MEKIKNFFINEKFSIIYALTFFVYPVMLFGNWAYYLGDYICVIIAVLLTIYELVYIIFLRKKENVGFGKSIYRFFLYALISLNTIPLIMFAIVFVNGYQEKTLFTGEPIGERYYGLEAMMNDQWTQFIFKLTFPTLIFYLLICVIIKAVLSLKKKIKENVHSD